VSDTENRLAAGDLTFLDESALVDFVVAQRWFGSKSRDVTHVRVLAAPLIRRQAPLLVLALVEVRFDTGTHELYQLPLGFRPTAETWSAGAVAEVDGWVAYDALADPALARELVHLVRSGAALRSEQGTVEFRQLRATEPSVDLLEARPLGGEQSNTSVVFGDQLILKSYRRIEAGTNPELEVLRFLTEQGFPNIAALYGWYSYSGAFMDATLGILQAYVPAGQDGWQFALDSLIGDADEFVRHVYRLGEVTGSLHSALASAWSDPVFCPEQPSAESLGLLLASVDEEIERVFHDLPDDEALAPIAGRGEEVREQLRQLTNVHAAGRVIRHHGDYHLGQVLWTGDDWVVFDFEGEPARSLPERRRKRSPLRDVAGMLRSFAYVASASTLANGVEPPPDWEERARAEFLAGYLATVDSSLLPPGEDAVHRLLSVFELEKAIYELRYELDHRPDWVRIPVAGIERMLRAASPA
jgi:maltokinase